MYDCREAIVHKLLHKFNDVLGLVHPN